jgi:hypothetical protein
MPNRIEYTEGQIVGKLMFIEEVPKRGKHRRAKFRCECGKEFVTYIGSALSGHASSCGCYKMEKTMAIGGKNKTHGQAGRRGEFKKEYRAWLSIKDRCENTECNVFEYYGGRGISICQRWLGPNGFSNFLKDMGSCPPDKDSVDRYPNNNGNYEPTNCRWADAKDQANNRRSCRLIFFNGETLNLTQWAERAGMNSHKLAKRLKRGWSMALATGIAESKPHIKIAYTFGFIN